MAENKLEQLKQKYGLDGSEIAIIGMSCRLPGANNIEEFWACLRDGKESLSRVSHEDLRRGGLDPTALDSPHYVPLVPVLDDIEHFDAGFFGYTALEAKVMDPQQRIFLECAWEAFEDAGHLPENYGKTIGVFAGAKTNTYLFNLFSNRDFFRKLDLFQVALGNDLACMATRVSYKFGLQGPSYALHTACSTSLVAVHLACQSLLLGECDMALAGGAAINVPQRRGYQYQKGGILSPDGHCRTFDEQAQGSNFGNGVGAVVLKRLEDAIEDGCHIYAVIKGSAVNNDGAQKASYTAPGVEGQTRVLLDAMAAANVDADSISYIEAHGTATDLGDSIEMLALINAFRATSSRNNYCAIGSVKTNIGHLETAAGIAGLIKTALALHHKQLPPSLHFQQPNPKIDFQNSPFYVNTKLSEWKDDGSPRRAGISSFGIGSTNSHVVLQEAPQLEQSSVSRPFQLLLYSARSENALEAAHSQLVQHLETTADKSDAYLADLAYTLKVGRKNFASRRALVCRNAEDASTALKTHDPARILTSCEETFNLPVVFLFPGLGDHYPGMGLELYRNEATFREHADRCAELLKPHLKLDIREVLFPQAAPERVNANSSSPRPDLRRMLGRSGGNDEAKQRLNQTSIAQPAIFVVEYALAQLWMEWGIRPQAMIGYSLGEYVAACLAGVLSLEDALELVAKRALMIQNLPPGAMLAVPMGQQEVGPLMARHHLSLGAVNGPAMCVLSGPVDAIEAMEKELGQNQVVCRRLETTHAFHSRMLDGLAAPLTALAAKFELHAPRIPFVSNATGSWIRNEEALDPGYWARHMTGPVLFDSGITTLFKEQKRIFLEVGPGQGLTSFIKQHPACPAEVAQLTFSSLPGSYDRRQELGFLLESLGKLWLSGQRIDWKGFYSQENRQLVPLPTYPFERQRYWVDPPDVQVEDGPAQVKLEKKKDIADWLYRPVWRPSSGTTKQPDASKAHWLIFIDDYGLGNAVAQRLLNDGHRVITVRAGETFAKNSGSEFTINPDRQAEYLTLLTAVRQQGKIEKILHLWSLSRAGDTGSGDESFDRAQRFGFYGLLFLAQALGRQALTETICIEVVTNFLQQVTDRDTIHPEKATMLGPIHVIPQEFPKIACRSTDVAVNGDEDEAAIHHVAAQMIAEFQVEPEPVVAYRNGQRLVLNYEACSVESAEKGGETRSKLRDKGVYLITGGVGGLGLVLAEHLAKSVQARLVLTGRSALPDRSEWTRLLAENKQGSVVEKIRAIQRIEELGSEVLTAAADASNYEQMQRAVDEGIQRFGAIHGVIHLAGVPGGGIIQLKTREMVEKIFAPKVRGTLVLEKIFSGHNLDFLVLYSSIASVLGEVGQADYCGASAFLDAYARKNAIGGQWPTLAINWEIWQEVGIGVNTEVPAHIRKLRQEMLANGILPSEGVNVFDRVLASDLPQVIVCPQDLQGRMELGKSLTADRFLQELNKQRTAQPQSPRRVMGTSFVAAGGSGLEQKIAEVWQRILGRDQIGVHDNFFDLGGNSLLGLQLVSELSQELDIQIAPVTLFEFPTVRALTQHLNPEADQQSEQAQQISERRKQSRETKRSEIAIIGMAGRFPGADNIEEFWKNLYDGKETVSFFTDEELLAAGVDPAVLRNPRYVRAASVLENIGYFDAALFGYAPREAEVMDPQHRIFLECAWEVLERAGYNPYTYPGLVGVFAGSNLSTYLLKLYADSRVKNSVNQLQALIGNDKDSLTTTVSYKLNLRGPSIAVQTFCSTSLVAVNMACQSLRHGECDMALAGGIRVVVPDRQGYVHEPGGLWPADGHTYSFDAKGNGSPFGNGVGIVCLKRLEDALADGDHIHAVIKGTAINNDGAGKAGYTAPSVQGQSTVIQAAFEDAGVEPETISYVEAHGSATELGDPIEISALSKAFRMRTEKKNFCAIGSVKSNFGHLDRAAGVTALIKTTLALEHQQIPPSINFTEPNPNIDFDNSPFFVNTALRAWEKNGDPRRAGVNSLGVGGTNVHVIVEEAPVVEPSGPSRPWQLLMISAKCEVALDQIGARLANHLALHPELNIGDVAYTLQVGRKPLEYRRIAVCQDIEDVKHVFNFGDPKRLVSAYREEAECTVAFMFPGMGAHYVNMARGFYDAEPAFRQAVDRCAEELVQYLGLDLRKDLYPESTDDVTHAQNGSATPDLRKMLKRRNGSEAAGRIDRTDVSQPLLFVIEYALAQLWMEWGIKPKAMIGYSLGEYVVACLAGVLSLEDALKLVAERAKLIQSLPPGSLLAVALSADQLKPFLDDELSLMAINGPEQSVVSGPVPDIEALEGKLTEGGISCRRLEASHAFHSRMMEPIFERVRELAKGIQLNVPQIPYISNVTGTWITPEEATDAAYWARHMCQSVLFSQGVGELWKMPGLVLLEMGPPMLSSIVLQSASADNQRPALSCLRHSYETQPDLAHGLQVLGKLWLMGIEPDWQKFYASEKRHRVLLPAYPFQRQRYWIETRDDQQRLTDRIAGDPLHGTEWFYVPSWKRSQAAPANSLKSTGNRGKWWIFTDALGVGNELASQWEGKGASVIRLGHDVCAGDYSSILNICAANGLPDGIVYLWGLTPDGPGQASVSKSEHFHQSLSVLGQALHGLDVPDALPAWIVGNYLHDVTGEEELQLEKAALLGSALALSREIPGLKIKTIDLPASSSIGKIAERITSEINSDLPERVIAYRAGRRWTPTLSVATPGAQVTSPVKEHGVYLLVNGLGPLGKRFAEYLTRNVHAKLALAESEGFPSRELWDDWLVADSGANLISNKIHQIRQLESEADVCVLSADLSSEEQAQSMVQHTLKHFGALDGVFYFFDEQKTRGKTLDNIESALLALDKALDQCEPGFRILMSPPPSVQLPAEESTLTFFLDGFAARSARQESQSWTSVTWLLSDEKGAAQDKAIATLFQLPLAASLIVSPEPLGDGWNKFDAAMDMSLTAQEASPISSYPRPNLRVAYAAPSTPTEETLAQLWRELLGVKEIGVHDNFLDLGGDSLMATRLISRMKDVFQQDVPVRLVFEASTIGELAKAVDETQAGSVDQDDMNELMQMLDQLSEDEVEQELLKRKQSLGQGA
ncbi:MAG TPA: SDR family NAD(P)-dependent oxidoreductase [Candidatus Solibacter sp.]|nr:SDR family NAD(P)-dependent oxidoreductase [Candidatus Solibacter sp.]